jgi:hypothetical protein
MGLEKRTRSYERDLDKASDLEAESSIPSGAMATLTVKETMLRRFSETSTGAASLPVFNKSNSFTPESLSDGSNRSSMVGGSSGEDSDRASVEHERSLAKARAKMQELIETERTYVNKSLYEIVNGYWAYMEQSKTAQEGRLPTPKDLLDGKDKIVFGNIRDIYEFHKKSELSNRIK